MLKIKDVGARVYALQPSRGDGRPVLPVPFGSLGLSIYFPYIYIYIYIYIIYIYGPYTTKVLVQVSKVLKGSRCPRGG
jgi:hypothetical protein